MGNAATAAGRRGILRWQRPTVATALPVGGVHLNLEAHVPGLRRVSYHLTVLLRRIAMNANGFEMIFRESSEPEKKAATIVTSTATTRIIHPPEDISLVSTSQNTQ